MKNNNKIIIATGIFPPEIGGPATHSLLLATELQKSGVDVVVVAYSDDKKEYDFKVIRISRKQNILKRYFKYFYAILKESNKNSIVYAQDPISSGLPACFASAFRRARFILKIVGDYAWEQGSSRRNVKDSIEDFQAKKYGFFVSVLKFLERFVAKRASDLVVPSQFLKSIVLKWGVKESRIRVVLNSYTKKDNIVCKNIHTDKKIIVSVARLVPWKGLDQLIKIMPEILEKNPDIILNIIGDGPEKNNLENLIEDLDLKEKVVLLGSISKDDVFCELKRSGVFVLNTSYEGLSHILLEALDAKVPIITTNVGGNPEVITNEENGVLVEIGDSEKLKREILRLFGDEESRNYLIKNGEKSLEKFKKEKMISEIFNILKIK